MGIFAAVGAAFKTIAGSVIGGFLLRTGLSIGLSLLAQKLAGKKQQQQALTGLQIPAVSVGEDISQSIMLGERATRGHLVYRNSHGSAGGRPNAYLVEVIELSDLPGVELRGLIINDRVATIGDTASDYGFPLTNIADASSVPKAWIKFYDGTQTTADSYLVAQFGSDADYGWTSAHVGTGTAYAILTYEYEPQVFQQQPNATFILSGIPLYDPRKDTTVGGDGAHRHNDPSTWEPSGNTAVQVYNILRGIPWPTGEVWGGGIAAEDIPLANAVAGMNICDALIGDRPQFRTSIEITVADDGDEPADVIEELLGGALGQIAEVGGVYRMRFGAPAAPVLSFTDGDISISDAQTLEPIKGLDASHNAVIATYVEPADLWQPRTTALLRNPTWEAEDGGRRLPVDLKLGTVTDANQATQVMTALIKDERRQIRHGLVLPPDALVLDPLDDVEWTSTINGYDSKDFEVVETVFRLQSGMVDVVLRERDPDDYDWTVDDDGPLPPALVPLPPRSALVLTGWAVTAAAIIDDDDVSRRPALRLSWSDGGFYPAQLVHWQVRSAVSSVVIREGVNVATDLQVTISDGILPDTGYEARGLLMSDGRATPWSSWLGAVTGDLRFGRNDLNNTLQSELDAFAADLDALNTAATEIVVYVDAQVANARADLEAADGVLANDISALTATVGDNTAAITSEAITRANADSALASDISTVTAAVGDLETSVSTQATAIADLEGNAAALLAFRVKAGSSGAALELVAADNPTGTVSTARIDADEIILDGTVTAEKMNVDELSAISATLGTFQTAETGERVVISSVFGIRMFDADDNLRFRIGPLI